jgi:ribonuclease E
VYRIDEQIAKALERKVWLPSGGSLVIDTTEAMTVIDVNTGKFTGQGGNLEQTVTRNNLEAAEEIVRQLRVRDVGGIIVIDFIDMVLESNRDLVLRRLLECLARDRTKHQVAEVTSLGLVQMTRKRVGSGLLEAFSVPCECCSGRGVVVSMEPVDHAPAADHHHGSDGSPRGGAARGGTPRAVRGSGEGKVATVSSADADETGSAAGEASPQATPSATATGAGEPAVADPGADRPADESQGAGAAGNGPAGHEQAGGASARAAGPSPRRSSGGRRRRRAADSHGGSGSEAPGGETAGEQPPGSLRQDGPGPDAARHAQAAAG